MDQSRFWIQKERTCLKSHVLSSFGDSWEEQAFAEDAAGPHGGCIWPPRSYTCTFCRREFRSAQALGGHMNVHRRDRARLKQISNQKNNQVHGSSASFDGCMLQNPNEIHNRNYNLDHTLFSSSSPRQSAASIPLPFNQQQKKSTPMLSLSKFEPRKGFHIAGFEKQEEGRIKVLESNSITSEKNGHEIEVSLSVNLHSLVRKRRDLPILNNKDYTEDCLIFKKRRTDDDAQTFFPKKSNSGEKGEPVMPLKHSPNSTLENIDLELRLGDRP